MSITAADIVLFKTQRMTDTDDGGGYPTSVTVTDNLSGDVFPGISELDSMGRTKFRKLAMGIDTETTDTYFGSGVYVSTPPTNADVEVVLLDATSYQDEASDIKSAIEAYLIKSVIAPMILYGPHPVGLTSIYAYQRTTDPIPQAGEVYVLDDGNDANDFFFRIVSVDSEELEFEDSSGPFTKRVITMQINHPLVIEFAGEDIPIRQTITPDVLIRRTVPADQIDFHSASLVSAQIDDGDQIALVESVYSHIMPSSEIEVPIVDYLAGSERTTLVPTCASSFPILTSVVGSHIFLPCAVQPLSVSVTGSDTFSDNGNGTLTGGSGIATINYDVADIIFPSSGTWTISAKPAASIIGPAHTMEIPIVQENRGFTYIRTLTPIPSPGQCFVDYRVDGLWYRIEDDGSGTLQGIGVGQINFTTGSLRVTLTAYPDIDSSIIITWATDVHLETREGDVNIKLPAMTGTLTDSAIDFSTVVASWLSSAVPKTATANAAGVFSGDGTGYIRSEIVADVYTCQYEIIPNSTAVPDPGSLLSLAYESRAAFTESFGSVPLVGDTYSFNINGSHLPLDPVKFRLETTVFLEWPWHKQVKLIIESDISGNLTSYLDADKTSGGDLLDAASNVNPTTGLVAIKFSESATAEYFFLGIWESFYINLTSPANLAFTAFGEKVNTYSLTSDAYTVSSIQLDLTPLDSKVVAADGIIIDMGTTRLYTKQGKLYKNLIPTTGSGTEIGSINYISGTITFTNWSGLPFTSISVKSLAVVRGDWGIDYVYGRVPTAPLRHGSFEISATTINGTTYTAIADLNGVVKDAGDEAILGTINDTTGVFSLAFGESVEDATLTPAEKLEPWYDPGNIEGGFIWRPTLMLPNSLRINAVGLFYLPADEEDIGIDSTRLPQDGRVRSLKKGDKVIIHHTDDDTMPNPLSAGQQVQLSRGELAICRIFDTEGDLVPTTKWSVNLFTGLVTMANPLDLTGYPQPLVARHTIRDSAKAIDVLIDGTINLSRQVSHTFPMGSYVSALLVAGDKFARYESLRTIETWIDFEHADGDPAIGQYNDIDYPITVTNSGCEDDEWAIVFQSPNAFVAIGQRRGQLIGSGSTNSDFAPVNPLTSLPFFTIYSAGWSVGFIAGNALRFKTVSAKFPFWTAQCIQPTLPPTTGDMFEWSTFGNVL